MDKFKVILIEGSDDKRAIVNVLTKLYKDNMPNEKNPGGNKKSDEMSYDVIFSEKYNYRFITHGGISDIARFDKSFNGQLARPDIEQILIIADADQSCQERNNELQKLIKNNISEPGKKYEIKLNDKIIKTGYFILPNNKDNGSLETLLLEAAYDKGKILKKCVSDMYECLEQNTYKDKLKSSKNKQDKLKLRLYLNGLIAHEDFHYDQTYKNELDFNHSCFKELKDFLSE